MKTALITLVAAMAIAPAALCAQPQLTPEQFVAQASEAGAAEVALGKVAAQKGSTPEVRAYGQRMVTDHSRSGVELEQLAGRKGLPVTKVPNAAHAKVLEDLNGRSGKDFDAAYAKQMVKDHDQAVALFDSASALADQELAIFASRTLPVLKEHQQQAGHLDGKH